MGLDAIIVAPPTTHGGLRCSTFRLHTPSPHIRQAGEEHVRVRTLLPAACTLHEKSEASITACGIAVVRGARTGYGEWVQKDYAHACRDDEVTPTGLPILPCIRAACSLSRSERVHFSLSQFCFPLHLGREERNVPSHGRYPVSIAFISLHGPINTCRRTKALALDCAVFTASIHSIGPWPSNTLSPLLPLTTA